MQRTGTLRVLAVLLQTPSVSQSAALKAPPTLTPHLEFDHGPPAESANHVKLEAGHDQIIPSEWLISLYLSRRDPGCIF